MIRVKTSTYTKVAVQEKYENGIARLKDLGRIVDQIYFNARYGKTEELKWEETPRETREGKALDCGIVYGPEFVIRKTDLYGDNPMYTYCDETGSIFLQCYYPSNSTVTLNGKAEKIWGFELEQNKDESEYIDQVTENLNTILKPKTSENIVKQK